VPVARAALGDLTAVSLLTAIMTHLDAARVQRQLDYLHRLAPESRFVVCHGGARADFDQLEIDDAIFVDAPSLRRPDWDRSHTEVITAVYEQYVRDDPDVDLVYFIEFDHLILSPDFEEKLEALARRSGAGLFGKYASIRNDTNWSHFTRTRDDGKLNRFFEQISCRDDPTIRWGCLGDGMLFRREALQAVATVNDPPHGYVEIFIPTLTYQLGFDVVDIDAMSDLYAAVRWRPEYSVDEALAEMRRGRVFVHPFKELDALELIWPAAPSQTATKAGAPT
jgi:hypothetical protein